MIKPPRPQTELRRLASLDKLGIMYTPAEERYDRITRLAMRLFGVPIALVSLIDERCQWFKSAQGLETAETPREISFCGHTILVEETFVVEDAANDVRFSDNPLVTGEPYVRFYAGHPVHASDGEPVGSLCIIDRIAREFGESERETLRDLAMLVEAELQREELHESRRLWLEERDEILRKVLLDGLTRTWSRDAILQLLEPEIARAARGTPLTVAMIDVDLFKIVNDTHGHPVGDRVLTEIATRIRAGVRDFDLVGRLGGEEFLVIIGNCRIEEAHIVCERVRAKIASKPVETSAGPLTVTVSIGLAEYGQTLNTIEGLLAAADKALYRAKGGGRNRVDLALAEFSR